MKMKLIYKGIFVTIDVVAPVDSKNWAHILIEEIKKWDPL